MLGGAPSCTVIPAILAGVGSCEYAMRSRLRSLKCRPELIEATKAAASSDHSIPGQRRGGSQLIVDHLRKEQASDRHMDSWILHINPMVTGQSGSRFLRHERYGRGNLSRDHGGGTNTGRDPQEMKSHPLHRCSRIRTKTYRPYFSCHLHRL